MNEHRTWREYLIEQLSNNRAEALEYFQFALDSYQVDGDIKVFLLSLGTFVETQADITELAKRTHMSPDALQKIFSSDKAPHVDTLCAILKALGCRLSVEPIEPEISDMESSDKVQSISAAG